MSFVDKAKNTAEELIGKAKEAVGNVTGNESLEREGQAEQAEANLKQTGEKVKDGVSDAADAVKDTFRKN